MSGQPYQLLPSLSADEHAALSADIKARGVMVPVEVDEAGEILDGHHRVRIASELGIDYPKVVRSGWTEDAKREHVLKVNLLRRQLGPIAWAEAFRKLAETRGARLGQGGRNDRTSATVAEVAAELGVAARTARHRLQLADQLLDTPDLAALVDAGTMPAKRALRVKRDRDVQRQREVAAARRAAEEAGKPVEKTRWHQWYEVEEWDPSDASATILTEDELEQVASTARWQLVGVDLAQREDYATRPMSWDGDELLFPTGRWRVAVVRFAGTAEDVLRRWWSWDLHNGAAIRKAADPALVYTPTLSTPAYLRQEHGPGSAWRDAAALLEVLEADAEALRGRLAARPPDLDDPAVVLALAERVVYSHEWERGPHWQRFRSWELEHLELDRLVVVSA